MYLESPRYLLLLLVLIPLIWRLRRKRSIGWSSVDSACSVGSTWRVRLAWIPGLVIVLSLVPLIVALCQPKVVREVNGEVHHGVAIMSVIDISSSMVLTRHDFRGEEMNRLEIAKAVLRDFVAGDDDELPGRDSDLVGLVTYARYPNSVCPPMIEHKPLLYFAENLKPDERPNEDGTAIGEAILLAGAHLARLNDPKPDKPGEKRYHVKSKVVVLLTDGQNNCGQHDPAAAAQMISQWGVKLHIIGFDIGEPDSSTEQLDPENQVLSVAATRTGGIFRIVRDGNELQSVYQEIDAMEKSEMHEEPELRVCDFFQPFAFTSVMMLGIALMLATTALRRTP